MKSHFSHLTPGAPRRSFTRPSSPHFGQILQGIAGESVEIIIHAKKPMRSTPPTIDGIHIPLEMVSASPSKINTTQRTSSSLHLYQIGHFRAFGSRRRISPVTPLTFQVLRAT